MSDPLKKYLKILRLQELPDREGLEAKFRELLKLYHPDLHPRRKYWAHGRTRDLLEAVEKVREEISRRTGPAQNAGAATTDHNGHRNNGFDGHEKRECDTKASGTTTAHEPSDAKSSGEASENPQEAHPQTDIRIVTPEQNASIYQLIQSERGNFAIPVSGIVKIVLPSSLPLQADQEKIVFIYEEEEYQMVDPTGEATRPIDMEPVLIFRDTINETFRYGVLIGKHIQSMQPTFISHRETIITNKEDGPFSRVAYIAGNDCRVLFTRFSAWHE